MGVVDFNSITWEQIEEAKKIPTNIALELFALSGMISDSQISNALANAGEAIGGKKVTIDKLGDIIGGIMKEQLAILYLNNERNAISEIKETRRQVAASKE